jgi:hypothetical protein
MPKGLAEFIGNILQYTTRVYAYGMLLTDAYPPFSLGTTDYPVNVQLPEPGRLNRAAVLFRIVLLFPVVMVAAFVGNGLELALPVIWLIVLISGRLPNAAFEAEASVLRYETRLYAFALMLTSEYPRGLFGDRAAAERIDDDTVRSVVTDAPDGDAEAAPDALPQPSAEVMPVGPPRITRLILSKGGKRLVVTFLVIGVLVLVGEIVAGVVIGSESNSGLRHLNRDYAAVVDASRQYGVAIQGCGLSSGGPDCVHRADQQLARDVRTFRVRLEHERFPASTLGEVDQMSQDAEDLATILDRMALTADPAEYQQLASQFQTAANQLDQDYRDLHDLLAFGA